MKVIAACVVVLTLVVLLREAQHQTYQHALQERTQRALDSWGDDSDSSDRPTSQHGDC